MNGEDLSHEQAEQLQGVREQYNALRDTLDASITECQADPRGIACAKTKLEEALMWAERAIRGD